MNPNNCSGREEQIAALVMDDLGPQEADELRGHLATCDPCRVLYDELTQEEGALREAFDDFAQRVDTARAADRQPSPGRSDRLALAGLQRSRKRAWPARSRALWAAAAVLVIGTLGLFSRFHFVDVSLGATLAEVMQQIQKAESVTYKKIIQRNGRVVSTSQEMAMDPGRLRVVSENGKTSVSDFVRGITVDVDPQRKTARLTHLVQPDHDRLTRYLSWLQALHGPGANSTFAGERELDGRKVNVFLVNRSFEQITVWADRQTNLPVRVERVISPSPNPDVKVPALSVFLRDFEDPGSTTFSDVDDEGASVHLFGTGPGVFPAKTTFIMTEFSWDVALDDSLFLLDVPKEYKVIKVDHGDPPENEQALLASLRFWAEMSGGSFPADINMLMDVGPKLVERFRKGAPAEEEYAAAVKMACVVVEGLCFAQTLKAANNWHYAGPGVNMGDTGKPLCWWKSDDGSGYRVVYGDLTVRTRTAADMPEPTK